MGRKEHVRLVCDLTGHEGDDVRNIPFGWDGEYYEIDLAPDEAAKLLDTLEYLAHRGRKVRAPTPSATPTTTRRRRRDSSEVREEQQRKAKLIEIRNWCKEQGIPCSDFGRLPADAVAAYDRWMEENPGAGPENSQDDEAHTVAVNGSGVPVPTFSAAS